MADHGNMQAYAMSITFLLQRSYQCHSRIVLCSATHGGTDMKSFLALKWLPLCVAAFFLSSASSPAYAARTDALHDSLNCHSSSVH